MHSQAYYQKKTCDWDADYVSSTTSAMKLMSLIQSGNWVRCERAMGVLEARLQNNFKPIEVDEFVDLEEVDTSKMGGIEREVKDPSLPAFVELARSFYEPRRAGVDAALEWLYSHPEGFFLTGRYTVQNKKESKLGLVLGCGYFVLEVNHKCQVNLLHPSGDINWMEVIDVKSLVTEAQEAEEQRLAEEERQRAEQEAQRKLEEEQRIAEEAKRQAEEKARKAEESRKAEEQQLLNSPFGALMKLKKELQK